MSFFSSRRMPELRFAITQLEQKSVLTGSIYGPLTWVLATLAVLAEESLTQAPVQTPSQPFSFPDGWQSQLPLSEDQGYPYRSRHSKSMDNTSFINIHSFIHSDIFILMIGTYLSLFKCLIWLKTLHIHRFFDLGSQVHTNRLHFKFSDFGYNFASLLSDREVHMRTNNYENGIPNWRP